MQELEKILEKIIKKSFCVEIREYESETVVLLDDVEEILEKHMNDGWIPVERGLPEEDGFYIATMDGKIVGQEEPFVGLAEFEDGNWVDGDDVIAWRPLPEPYRPERI